METKFSHEDSKTQREDNELGTYVNHKLYLNFFVPSCLCGMSWFPFIRVRKGDDGP